MSATGEEDRVARLRMLAERVVERVGGVPAVRTLLATLAAYDAGGGGLVAGGLAYSALIALLPGMLLVISIFGLVVQDETVREQLVVAIGGAVPPLEDLARTALTQVSAGAVPGGIIATVGLLWAASRFYAALDIAISRIFLQHRRRDEVRRTLRGLALTVMLVLLPLAAVFAGSLVSRVVDLIPGTAFTDGVARTATQLAWPVGTFLLFVLATMLVYRYVPPERVPARAWRLPAVFVGLVMAGFTQLFALLAPLMLKTAALYGAIVTVFALLAWMAIAFNMLLLGAAWTWVRTLDGTAGAEAVDDAGPPGVAGVPDPAGAAGAGPEGGSPT
jgi:membrane protein